MIRVLSRTVRAVVVLVSLGAGAVPLGCKLATKDNPAVCVADDASDHCAEHQKCVNNLCIPDDAGAGGGKAASGTGGSAGNGGAGGSAMVGAGGGAGLGGAGGLDSGMDGGVDQSDPMDAAPDKPTCTPDLCPMGTHVCSSDGRCVECAMDKDCSAPNPFCDTEMNKCGKCTETSCSTRPMTPVCDRGSGACVACNTSPDCKTDMTKQFCNSSEHACVGCLSSGDCPTDKPICDPTHNCVGCSTDAECKARDQNAPACDTTAKRCLECTTSAHCTADPKKPICVKNACVACTADKYCSDKLGADPGICMFHQDGRCATDAETLYVQKKSSGCAMTAGGGAGSSAMPFCLPQTAVELATTPMSTKRLIVLRGGMALANFSAAPAEQELSVIGQSDAQISPGTFPGIHLTAGSLYVRGISIVNGTDVGIRAEMNTTLRLDRVFSYGNTLGGLVTTKASFDIVNSIFAGNGSGSVGPASFGGVYLGAAPANMPARFAFNTIANNKDKGLVCENGQQAVKALLLSGNAPNDTAINCTIGPDSRTGGDPMFQTGVNNFQLTKTSPCTDAAVDVTPVPGDDYGGAPRPSGMVADCGAFEYVGP